MILNPLLQIWEVRPEGWKPTQHTLMVYQTGSTANEYVIMLANHRNYPDSNGRWTGRLQASVADSDWQGTRIQAKEIGNGDPNSCGMSTTTDVAYANLHQFKMESIAPGGWRVIKLKIVGTGLTFADVTELVTWTYPVAA